MIFSEIEPVSLGLVASTNSSAAFTAYVKIQGTIAKSK
jgi:hypothetical protein